MVVTAARAVDGLPKGHLHLHADGSFPNHAVRELAARRGVAAPEPPDRFNDTSEFFEKYLEVPALIGSLDELSSLCRELVESEAVNGVTYLEPGIEPQIYAPRLGTLNDVLSAMWAGFRDGAVATGIEVGCMVGVNTDFSVELAAEVARMAAQHAGDGVVAFGTAGFVEPAGLARFKSAVEAARASGLKVVCHAGQVGGPESVVEALEELHPDRIAHGINAARDPRLLHRLAEEGVVCDVCLTSNVRLGVVPTYAEHPLPRMLEAGVSVTLNADDEYWFGSSISHEFELAREVFGLSDETLAQIARAATWRTGASDVTVRRTRAGINDWLHSDPAETL
jgi:adenosine deaminase